MATRGPAVLPEADNDELIIECPADAIASSIDGTARATAASSLTEGIPSNVAAYKSQSAIIEDPNPSQCSSQFQNCDFGELSIEVPLDCDEMIITADEKDTIPEQHVVIESVEDAFSEMVQDVDLTSGDTIHVIFDGANIGWSHGDGHFFSPIGIALAIDNVRTIAEHRHVPVEISAFLPSSYVKRKPKGGSASGANAVMQTEDWDMLTGLIGERILTLVPPGDHDDVYLLNYARFKNGFVVSNDFFEDHVKRIESESVRSSMRMWLASRRCSYVFTKPFEFMLNPDCELSVLLGIHPLNWTPSDPIGSAAVYDATASVVGICRCGVRIEQVDRALIDLGLFGLREIAHRYNDTQFAFVYAHLSASLQLMQSHTLDNRALLVKQIVHCLLSQDPECYPAAELLKLTS